MKLIKIYIPVIMTFVLTSCSQDEPLMDTNPMELLTISVTDNGFQTESRSVENGYTTQFTDGDKCGLYIVNNGSIVVDNLKITASVADDGDLAWVADNSDGIKCGTNGEQYFLYYPYTENITDKVDASATHVNDFFASLIADWTPNNNQSDYATGYSASDLMVGVGVINGNQLSFSMRHCMSLISLKVPNVTYVFTDNTIPDFTTPAVVDFSNSSVTPFRMNDGTYRLIWNYRQGIPTIVGRYLNGKKEITVSPGNLSPGCCVNLIVRDESEKGKTMEYALAMGDYFCKDSDGKWYIIPQEAVSVLDQHRCIGIVFHAGQRPADQYDYTSTGIGQKNCHGYVVALTDVHNDDNDRLRWEYGPNQESNLVVGTSTTVSDWQGYSNSLKFHEFVNSNTGWEMKHFPAALACETYGNRTLDQDGNPAEGKYDWQQPLAAPSNTSGWFLPSCGQLNYLFSNYSLLSARMTDVKNSIPVNCNYRAYIKWFTTPLTWSYWSSTENVEDTMQSTMCMDFPACSMSGNYKRKNTVGVRAVLAF